MSRCRQLTVQQLHVVGMELMYEKTFNSSSHSSRWTFLFWKTPDRPVAFIIVPTKTTTGGHWHGSTRNVNDTLTKISEIKENLRPPEILVRQLIPKSFVSNNWPEKVESLFQASFEEKCADPGGLVNSEGLDTHFRSCQGTSPPSWSWGRSGFRTAMRRSCHRGWEWYTSSISSISGWYIWYLDVFGCIWDSGGWCLASFPRTSQCECRVLLVPASEPKHFSVWRDSSRWLDVLTLSLWGRQHVRITHWDALMVSVYFSLRFGPHGHLHSWFKRHIYIYILI